MTTEPLAADFWNWAVATYSRPGVGDLCLVLQDEHGQCVPLVLWAAWRAAKGSPVDSEMAAQAACVARQWSGEVIEPLRTLRRRLKSPVSHADDSIRLLLREKIKASELDAEKALMGLLAEIDSRPKDEKPFSGQGIEALMPRALMEVAHAWSLSLAPDATKEALQAFTHTLTKG